MKKYEMTEDEYDQRPGTLREYKKKKLAEDPNFKFFPKVRAAASRPTAPGPHWPRAGTGCTHALLEAG